MKNDKILLGARIKELRKQKKLSQNILSEKVDIGPKHLSQIEVGHSFPSLDTLTKIAKALQVEMKDFFEFVPETTKRDLVQSILKLLQEADTEKLRLIYKIIKIIVR